MRHDVAVPENADPLVATPEAMSILGFANKSSVARLVYERKLFPERKLPGKNGAYLFRRVDIERLAAERAAAKAAS